MQNSQDININFTHLPTLLAHFKHEIANADAKKPFDDLILQANDFNYMLQMTIRLAMERQKVSQPIASFYFIEKVATELFENIEKTLKKLPDSEDKAQFESQLKYLKNNELRKLVDNFKQANYTMTPAERYELFKNSGIDMLNENYAKFHSPSELGRVIAKFSESFKSEGFSSVSFNIHTPPLTETESEQIRGNMKSLKDIKKEYLMAIFKNAAKHGYPPSAVKITLDGEEYSHDDELFKKSTMSELEKTAESHNRRLVDSAKEQIEGYRSRRRQI